MKLKIKKNIINNNWLLITLGISSVITMIIFILQKVAPFGPNSMLDVDFYHQYGPLLNELYDRVTQGETLLYSFNTGGGLPFYRNFLNYLSSPFNILLFLFKKENIVMVFSLIIGAKVIFASVSMAYYLRKTFNKNTVLICIFGILYAYSGYFCAYYWNIMWLDGIVFLPLIMFGINKIIDGKSPALYVIALATMLFANYFIGYMICIYSVLYFIAMLFLQKKFKIKKVIVFAISSILAGGLVAFALLPLFNSLLTTSATSGGLPTQTYNFSIPDYLFNHISGVSRTVFASDPLPLPNVYCGLLTIVSILLLFMNNNIKLRYKIVALVTLILFYCCFNITIIDYALHAFHVPNDLPWRYSFLYVFTLILIAYYNVINNKGFNIEKVAVSFGVVIIYILLSCNFKFINLDITRAITCIVFLVCYFIIYIIYKYKPSIKKELIAVLIVMVSGEVIYGINSNWSINHSIESFMSDKPGYQELIKNIRSEDNNLYRIEKTDSLTLNDGAWYDYYAMSTFTSMAYEDVAKFQRMFGMPGNNINSYFYKGYQTPIYNTMFNIKYILGDYIENDYYSLLDTNDTANITSYNYASSIAYAVDNNIKSWKLESYIPFYNQGNFVKLATGVEDIYKPLQVVSVTNGKIISNTFDNNSNGEFSYELDQNLTETALNFELYNDKKQNIYLYIGGASTSVFFVNDVYYSISSDEYYTIDVGKHDAGNVNIKINLDDNTSGIIKFYAYAIDDDAFQSFYQKIDDAKLKVKKYSETYIEGTINADSTKTVFTTLAYDKGFSVYVDGKKTDTYKLADAYLGFDIQKGDHKVVIKYYPYLMKEGLLISCISLIIVAFYICYEKKIYKR